MIAILLTVCLIGDPGTCRDYKITLTPGVTLTQCLRNAPPHIARWRSTRAGISSAGNAATPAGKTSKGRCGSKVDPCA